MGSPPLEIKGEIAALVAGLFGLSDVDDDEDFFAMGGEAVFVEQLSNRVRERFSVKLSPEDIHGAPTVAGLAALLEASAHHDETQMPVQRGRQEGPSRPPSLGDRFLHQAMRQPDAIAVRDGKQSLTYGELKTRASTFARRIREARAHERQVVAVLAERNCDLIVGMLAATLSGSPCAMLSPSMWRHDLAGAMEGSVVLGERRLVNGLAADRLLLLDQPAPPDREPHDDHRPPIVGARETDTAFVVHPAKEAVSHAALVGMVDALELAGFPSIQVAQCSAALSRNFLVEVWSALARGGIVRILPELNGAGDARSLQTDVDAAGPLSLIIPIAAAGALMKRCRPVLAGSSAVLLLGSGGDAATLRDVANLVAELPILMAVSVPGIPTAILGRVSLADSSGRISVIGKPIAGVSVEITNEDGRPLAPGSPGKCWVRVHACDPLPTGWNGRVLGGDELELLVPDDSARRRGPPENPLPKHGTTPTQRQLTEMWADLLHLPAIAAHSDFFALGGNSLLAMRMIARVNAEWDIAIAWPSFLRHPTIADLAATVDQALPTASAALRPHSLRQSAQLLSELESLSDDQVKALLHATETTQ